MNKIFWMIVSVVILATSFAVVKFGMRPQPITIIKPSSFERPQLLGEVVYKQTRQRLHEDQFLIAGLELNRPTHFEILKGVLDFATKDETPYQKIIIATQRNLPGNLRELLKGSSVEQLDPGAERFKIALAELGRSNTRTVIVVDQNSALHSGELVTVIEKALGHPVYSLVMAETALDPKEPLALPSPCEIEDEFDRILSHNLGCYVRRQTLIFSFNKRFKHDRFAASFEQMGTNDYVLYTHSP